jgi:hypothetical protein
MTATLTNPAPQSPPPESPAPAAGRPRSTRWLRLVIPFAVVIALLLGTGIVHELGAVDVTDPAYLSPTSAEPFGGQRLAGRLAQRGVTVERVRKSSDALVRAHQGDVTLFVPAPGLMHPYYLRMLKLMPASTRVVLVAPGGFTLGNGHLPVISSGSRFTTRTASPGCAISEARQAGTAEAYHTRYDYDTERAYQTARCYDGGLVGVRYAAAEVLAIGASEPFRNDRIDAYGNAALATGLLSAHRTVVWLDLHRGEPMPGLVQQSPDPNLPAAPPSLGTGGKPDPDFPIEVPQSPRSGGSGGDESDSAAPPPPVWLLLPPWAWAALGLLFIAAFAYALARARRLGPPVSEPLPVAVRAAETVEGRGRLYRRAKAREVAVDALRTSALHRLRPALGLPPDADRPTVAAAVATPTGRPEWQVDGILYGAQPADDDQLVQLVGDLDSLVHTLTDVPKGERR